MTSNQETLLGAVASAAVASPNCNSAVLPVRNIVEIFCTGNTECIALRPIPLGGLVAQEGGLHLLK